MHDLNRRLAEAFFRALASRDPQHIASYLSDDVDWMSIGPVEMLSFCGPHRGKAAVVEVFERRLPAVVDVTSFVTDVLLVDGVRAAGLNRLTARLHATGRVIACRLANFLRFEDGKVCEYRSLMDSFAAVEEFGRLDLHHGIAPISPDVMPFPAGTDLAWR